MADPRPDKANDAIGHTAAWGMRPRALSDADRGRSGSAALEFGLAIPLLLIILMGVAELGFAMHQAMQVYNAVEAGALYAAQNGFDSAGITTAVEKATGSQGISATPAPQQFCGCPGVAGIAETSCSSTCSSGSPPGHYVRISAALAHQTILPYPPLPLPKTLTAKSVIRLN